MKKLLSELDAKIKEVKDKPPEYFIGKFQNGEGYQDSNILQIQKHHLITTLYDNIDGYRIFSASMMNHVSKLYQEYIESQACVKELQEKLKSK